MNIAKAVAQKTGESSVTLQAVVVVVTTAFAFVVAVVVVEERVCWSCNWGGGSATSIRLLKRTSKSRRRSRRPCICLPVHRCRIDRCGKQPRSRTCRRRYSRWKGSRGDRRSEEVRAWVVMQPIAVSIPVTADTGARQLRVTMRPPRQRGVRGGAVPCGEGGAKAGCENGRHILLIVRIQGGLAAMIGGRGGGGGDGRNCSSVIDAGGGVLRWWRRRWRWLRVHWVRGELSQKRNTVIK